ncbi:MAG: septum formation inhibitor Maf [Clostridia bacterium]|nr:septum formation inhibitor Maf [Clostridia bacterium]
MAESLILASSSPRRRELMGYTGIPFEVITADAEELKTGEPDKLVMENARRKAKAVWDKHPGRVVLGADTIVYQHGKVLGKPRDEKEAAQMLHDLSGAWHAVYTGVCVIRPDGEEDVRVDISKVQFVPLEDEVIQAYVKTKEPMDKAGAYALQGIGGMYVQRIEGSYSNVIGLPMALARDMLRQAGIQNL